MAYIGDSEDDEGCFEMVGYPVVALLAPDDFKVKCAQKYRAFVPNSETVTERLPPACLRHNLAF